MLTQVDAYNQLGDKLELPLDILPTAAQYVITKIDGLGPVKAEIATTTYVTMPGGKLQNKRTGMRNVVFYVGFSPDWSTSDDPYGDLRRALYPWFSPDDDTVKLRFHDTKLGELELNGTVESCEPDIFNSEPTLQISVVCTDPYFYALDRVLQSRVGPGVFSVTNPGSAKTGFTLVVNGISTPVGGITIARTAPLADNMSYVGSLYAQGLFLTLKFVTVKGKKSSVLATNEVYNAAYDDPDAVLGVSANILGWVNDWIEVLPGVNTFDVEFDTSNPSQNAKVAMSFIPRYIGL